MSFSVYLWSTRLFTLLSLGAWLGIVIAVDPTEAGRAGIFLFFGSLFTFVLGVMTLIVTTLYERALGVTGALYNLGTSFRQALLTSLFLVGLIFFQKEGILTWWVTLLFLVALLLSEFSFRRIFETRKSV